MRKIINHSFFISGLIVIILLLSGNSCSFLLSRNESSQSRPVLEIVDTFKPEQPENIYRDFGSFFFNDDGSFTFADHISKQVSIYDPAGHVRHYFGKKGAYPGCFNAITDIDKLPNGHIMVVDAINQTISEFDLEGNFIGYIVEFEMNQFHPKRNRIVYESKEAADSVAYMVQETNKTFFLSPYCDAQIVDHRYIFLAGHEQGPYYRNDLKNLNLIGKFYWPELTELFRGGRYSKVYRRSIRPLQSYDFACVDDQVDLIEANVPYITRLNEFLEFQEIIYHERTSFQPIPEDFKEDIFLEDNLKPLFDYIHGCSVMQRIFQHGPYVITYFKTIGNFENFLKDTYRHHYYNFQNYTEGIDLAEFSGGDDHDYLQVLSKDLQRFFDDLELKNRFLGFNKKYIYLAGNPQNPLQKNRILKCRIKEKDNKDIKSD
ncbi:hypothetical protein KJ762_13940 [bacterium]|nr:hypothetical protein [bacterium]MBU1635591.1 hypothetical protein [bacterium]MBU1873749.1 hypothetical protein [bacterium]